MAQENRKPSRRYTIHHENHHKEDPKITLEDSWGDSNQEANEACLMAVGSQKHLDAFWRKYTRLGLNLGRNVIRLQLYTKRLKYCIHTMETASGFLVTPSGFASDGIRILMMMSKRNRLKEALEDSA
ncbi:hypothetical protein Tco_0628969 [Tanacetum coccineum]|uniref:Uncharacterized protein n=1 Tax=Tanacetum coccineum TaxID=301880 RepID=A0ABQ4WRS6_9ASTR